MVHFLRGDVNVPSASQLVSLCFKIRRSNQSTLFPVPSSVFWGFEHSFISSKVTFINFRGNAF